MKTSKKKKTKKKEVKRRKKRKHPRDEFRAVARRLEADEDKGRFEVMLEKIAKARSKD